MDTILCDIVLYIIGARILGRNRIKKTKQRRCDLYEMELYGSLGNSFTQLFT